MLSISDKADIAAALAEIKAAQCPDPEIRTFYINGHLSDNQEFMTAIDDFCDGHGQIMLLDGGTGIGKTKMILEDLTSRRDGKNDVLLVVPTSAQSDQNKTFKARTKDGDVNVRSFNRNSNGSIEFKKHGSKSMVFESIGRADGASEEELASTVFVFDEAHEKENAKNYRGNILSRLARYEAAVLKAGGNVILMTATPHRIEGYPVDVRFNCVRVDDNGNRINGITASELVLYRKPSKKGSVADLAIVAATQMMEEGMRPMLYIQDKSRIETLKRHFESQGLRVVTLTADNKGYITEDIVRDDGSVESVKAYDSEAYRMLQEEALLPEADIYLVTSVLEKGLSIKGIRMDDGSIKKDPDLTPTYVCLRPHDFDFDNMRQFFARPRFPINRAAIVMNAVSNADKDAPAPNYEDTLMLLAAKAILYCNSYNAAPSYRINVPTIQGDIEGACVREIGPAQYEPDYAMLISESWTEYYRQLYNAPDHVIKALEDEFEIPVRDACYNKVPKIATKEPIVISDKLSGLLDELSRSPTFEKDVTSNDGTALTRKIVKETGGRKIIERIKKYTHSRMYDSPSEIVKAAIAVTQQPNAAIRKSDGTVIEDPDRASVLAVIERASKMSLKKGQIQQWVLYYNETHKKSAPNANSEPYINTSCIPGDLLSDLIFIQDTPEMDALMRLWQAVNYSLEWKTVCKTVINNPAENVLRTIKTVYDGHNAVLCYDPSKPHGRINKDYESTVLPFTSVSGAQYHVLRYPGKGFYYTDRRYANETDENIRRKHSSYHFAETFINKCFYQYDVQQIAKQMNSHVRAICPTASEKRFYSEDMMLQILRSMFVCTKVKCKAEDGYCYRVRNLRLDGISVLSDTRPSKEQIIVDLDECLSSDMRREDKLIATLDAKAMLKGANVPQTQADELSNVISSLFSGDNETATSIDNNIPYKQGTLQSLVEHITVTVMDTTYNVDGRAIPPALSSFPEGERATLAAQYKEYLKLHKFYWCGQWYRLPHDAGPDVPAETAHFWNTGYPYDDWVRSVVHLL